MSEAIELLAELAKFYSYTPSEENVYAYAGQLLEFDASELEAAIPLLVRVYDRWPSLKQMIETLKSRRPSPPPPIYSLAAIPDSGTRAAVAVIFASYFDQHPKANRHRRTQEGELGRQSLLRERGRQLAGSGGISRVTPRMMYANLTSGTLTGAAFDSILAAGIGSRPRQGRVSLWPSPPSQRESLSGGGRGLD